MKANTSEKTKNAKSVARPQTQAPTEVIEALRLVLSDTFVLYMKTYAVHWNYQGPKFFSVHKMTEEQYENLAEAIDQIAERIRALHQIAPISLQTILSSADLEEMSQADAGNDHALVELANSHMLLAQRAHKAAEICGEVGDLFSEDMMIQRIGEHEKAAWMLRSFMQTPGASQSSETYSS